MAEVWNEPNKEETFERSSKIIKRNQEIINKLRACPNCGLKENEFKMVSTTKYSYRIYECQHCGHKWVEFF